MSYSLMAFNNTVHLDLNLLITIIVAIHAVFFVQILHLMRKDSTALPAITEVIFLIGHVFLAQVAVPAAIRKCLFLLSIRIHLV